MGYYEKCMEKKRDGHWGNFFAVYPKRVQKSSLAAMKRELARVHKDDPAKAERQYNATVARWYAKSQP